MLAAAAVEAYLPGKLSARSSSFVVCAQGRRSRRPTYSFESHSSSLQLSYLLRAFLTCWRFPGRIRRSQYSATNFYALWCSAVPCFPSALGRFFWHTIRTRSGSTLSRAPRRHECITLDNPTLVHPIDIGGSLSLSVNFKLQPAVQRTRRSQISQVSSGRLHAV